MPGVLHEVVRSSQLPTPSELSHTPDSKQAIPSQLWTFSPSPRPPSQLILPPDSDQSTLHSSRHPSSPLSLHQTTVHRQTPVNPNMCDYTATRNHFLVQKPLLPLLPYAPVPRKKHFGLTHTKSDCHLLNCKITSMQGRRVKMELAQQRPPHLPRANPNNSCETPALRASGFTNILQLPISFAIVVKDQHLISSHLMSQYGRVWDPVLKNRDVVAVRGRGVIAARALVPPVMRTGFDSSRGRFLAGSLPDFRMRESYRTAALFGGFSRGSPPLPGMTSDNPGEIENRRTGLGIEPAFSGMQVRIKQHQNARAGETGNPRENPPTRGIVRHDFHLRKLAVTQPGIEPSPS
ncbi:hypothetical protein PR048_002485 [Dryococelus australis]|uniref:Uncharacterized protein n=1 Tax=Dryococelus australis TaxID=614101 RepID=A0ABQ9IKD2_9NEOP|nr:hypothetical protein PR048_002485 [Dryococelus australis]